MPRSRVSRLYRVVRTSLGLACGGVCAAAPPTAEQIEEILAQNRRLQEQVRAQQKTIDELSARMGEISRSSERQERELRGLADRIEGASPAGNAAAPTFNRDSGVRIAAEAGLAFFRTGRNGQFPNGGFRVDDPVISIEAPVLKDVYFFTELRLLPRETNAEDFELGEIYVDFEDVLRRWKPGLLNVRVGRLNIPFGEEYLVRTPVTNPLISHSLSDVWGVDEGVEIYGRVGPVSYVLAVQDGGSSRLRDFHEDKSVTARVGWQPLRWLSVSGSAMRTGRMDTLNENVTEVWFGNGFFRALGSSTTTPTYWAELAQIDATARWKGGHASAVLGRAWFDDSDTRADNARRLRYGYLELVQQVVEDLYAAARYSAIQAPKGYPIAGWGPLGSYFFRPGVLTEELSRLSLGFGYRFGPPLVLKIEYAWERGRLTTGVKREHGDFFGTELGVRF